MANEDSGSDPVDRAMRLLVYGPVGLACYLKDSAPTFLDLFVSRGKREVDGARRTVEQRLGLARPEPEPAPSVQRRVTDGLGRVAGVAAQAGTVAAQMAGSVVNAAAGTPTTTVRTQGVPGVGNPETAVRGAAEAAAAAREAGAPAGADASAASGGPDPADLPIAGYDGLSASQVIERLEGMSRGALELIRSYELAHRARRTILASIDQLTG